MIEGIAHLITHPIQSIRDLANLPGVIRALIANAPEYWERFRAMPLNDQIREVSRTATTIELTYGGAAGTTTQIARAAGQIGGGYLSCSRSREKTTDAGGSARACRCAGRRPRRTRQGRAGRGTPGSPGWEDRLDLAAQRPADGDRREICVQRLRMAATAGCGGDHNAIDVVERCVAGEEPRVVGALDRLALGEREQEPAATIDDPLSAKIAGRSSGAMGRNTASRGPTGRLSPRRRRRARRAGPGVRARRSRRWCAPTASTSRRRCAAGARPPGAASR